MYNKILADNWIYIYILDVLFFFFSFCRFGLCLHILFLVALLSSFVNILTFSNFNFCCRASNKKRCRRMGFVRRYWLLWVRNRERERKRSTHQILSSAEQRNRCGAHISMGDMKTQYATNYHIDSISTNAIHIHA